jgi:hypothetical protein
MLGPSVAVGVTLGTGVAVGDAAAVDEGVCGDGVGERSFIASGR